MVIDCPAMKPYRDSCGIAAFISSMRVLKPQISSTKVYALYLDDKDVDQLSSKTQDLLYMYVGWFNLMEIDI